MLEHNPKSSAALARLAGSNKHGRAKSEHLRGSRDFARKIQSIGSNDPTGACPFKGAAVRAAVLEEKLLKRPEFNQLRLVITRDESDADIILELRHDLLTKYVFTDVDTRTQTVLAGGKVSSLGGTVAGKVAKRFVKELARSPTL